ncbi:phosphoglycolate phosphatase [Plantactinospora sp. BC1]|uniref:HAD-IA family hydrolase n=1 Tax=Plantactinospora sp. BC1 TaxID=2108470 RepID=UPI000D179653|nr:HAD-IA family hydrolase [Plantactinospora sp. BC1]AVT33702.1 phosphoglycolate phosphatase [Plantactinospora sp. BC1]
MSEETVPCHSSAARPGLVTGTALRGVVFDLDGVLVNSFDVMRLAFDHAFREVVGDGEAPFEAYRQHLGGYFPDIMRLMGLPPELEGPFVRESYRLAHQINLYDGVGEMLVELRERGIRCAVATGKSGPRARSLLDGLGVLEIFDCVVGSDEVDRPKPAPDIVRRALYLMDVDRDAAVMIGDAVFDVMSARAAGVGAVAALWGECDREVLLAAGPDASVENPAEFLALLRARDGAAGSPRRDDRAT